MTRTDDARPADKRSVRDTTGEDLLNERFHTPLRDAAEKREIRARSKAHDDEAAAAQESLALFTLARTREV